MFEQSKPKTIAVVGNKKSGKTSLITFLTSNLTQKGLKIASIKHVHKANFTVDSPQTDSWRYIQSGARVAVCVSQDEIATIRRTKAEDCSLEVILGSLEDDGVDVVLLEGFRYLIAERDDVPKIVTAKSLVELKELLEKIRPPILSAVGEFNSQTDFKGIKLFNLKRDGDKILLTVQGYLSRIS